MASRRTRGGQTIWLTYNETKQTYEPNEHAASVRRLFEIASDATLNYEAIANQLNAEKLYQKGPSNKWDRWKVQRRLSDSAVYEAQPAVVSKQVFDDIQAAIVVRRLKGVGKHDTKKGVKNVFTGLLTCGECGKRMRFYEPKSGVPYLRCHNEAERVTEFFDADLSEGEQENDIKRGKETAEEKQKALEHLSMLRALDKSTPKAHAVTKKWRYDFVESRVLKELMELPRLLLYPQSMGLEEAQEKTRRLYADYLSAKAEGGAIKLQQIRSQIRTRLSVGIHYMVLFAEDRGNAAEIYVRANPNVEIILNPGEGNY